MLKRVTSLATSGALGLAAAVALLPASAHAAPQTYTGHLQAIVGDTIVGCASDSGSGWTGFTTNAASAYTVTIAEGPRQDMPITGRPGLVLGVDDLNATWPMSQSSMGYTFLNPVPPVPAGSPSVNRRQSAIWTIDAGTQQISADYVWNDSSSQPVENWAYDGGTYLGLTPSVTEMARTFPSARRAVFRLGEACSGRVVLDAAQAITFTSVAPTTAHPGETYDVAATGGASGNAVTFSSATTDVCAVDGATVTFTKPGTCTISANQAGATGYSAAPTATQDVTVTAIPSSVALSLDLDTVFDGQVATATADVTVTKGSLAAAGGAVQFAVDGTDVGTPVTIDADGRAVSPELEGSVGTHEVTATYVPADSNYAGSTDTATLTVTAKAPQAITFTSSAPTPAYPGKTYTIAATGGASGKPVALSSTTAEHCTIDGDTVTFGKPGTCTIEATQAGSAGFTAAPAVTQDITVSAIPSSVTVNLGLPSVVTGQRTTATADVSVAAGSLDAAGGTVQFAVDGTDVGSPVAIDADGRAVSPELGGPVGSRQVTATYVPADGTHYVGSSNAATLTVAAASTTTKVSVTASELTATVAPVAPGEGTPTGEVTFHVDGKKVGSATLANGTAKLAHAVATDTTHAVSAEYAGDAGFSASSASTSRSNPGITAKVGSRQKSRNGWYRTPVTVTFTCDAKGIELVTACPKPVTVTKQGASSVTRTIRTADGGIATATAAVKVDSGKPRVTVKGVKSGRSYFDSPKPKCVAKDAVSGLEKCRVTSKRRGNKVVVTAKATDVAGNVSTKRVTYRRAEFTIRGAKKVGSTYRVKQGETYTLQVRGAKARYVYATPAPGRPHRGSVPFKKAGKNTWTLGVTMSMTTSGTRSWNLGYTQNGKLHVIKVKVVG